MTIESDETGGPGPGRHPTLLGAGFGNGSARGAPIVVRDLGKDRDVESAEIAENAE